MLPACEDQTRILRRPGRTRTGMSAGCILIDLIIAVKTQQLFRPPENKVMASDKAARRHRSRSTLLDSRLEAVGPECDSTSSNDPSGDRAVRTKSFESSSVSIIGRPFRVRLRHPAPGNGPVGVRRSPLQLLDESRVVDRQPGRFDLARLSRSRATSVSRSSSGNSRAAWRIASGFGCMAVSSRIRTDARVNNVIIAGSATAMSIVGQAFVERRRASPICSMR